MRNKIAVVAMGVALAAGVGLAGCGGGTEPTGPAHPDRVALDALWDRQPADMQAAMCAQRRDQGVEAVVDIIVVDSEGDFNDRDVIRSFFLDKCDG